MDYVQIMAMDLAVRLSGADTGYIGLFQEEQIKIAQAIGGYGDVKAGSLIPITPLVKRIQEDLQPRLIADVKAEKDDVVVHPKTIAQMLLPLVSSDRIIGILNIETSKPERFTEDTFEFLKLVTARVAVALDNARLYQIAQERYDELQRLYTQVSGLEQLKTDMIRVAAHDLRNPASVIIGYVELVRRVLGKEADKRAVNYLDMIDKATRRIKKSPMIFYRWNASKTAMSKRQRCSTSIKWHKKPFMNTLNKQWKKNKIWSWHYPMWRC
ncbi:MAG TPA: GAF domain-containing protein, partial [Aggregatilineales bacterium]|nr:GAF domain-containing protein [Aggregatilineales bacterium]